MSREGNYIVLVLILAISLTSGAVQAQQASDFGANIALTIRDCTGIAPLDSCVWPGDPPHSQNRWIFGSFPSTTDSATFSLSEPGYGGGEAGVVFSGDLFTPTLLNSVSSTSISRNGTSIFGWQVVTYVGPAPLIVTFGGDFTYSKTGTVDASCAFFKDVDAGSFQFTHGYNKDQCGSILIRLDITDLDTNQLVASEFVSSDNGEIAIPRIIEVDVEMIPGRPYEIYAVVQTIVRGAGQSIDSSNSFEIGLVDPVTGEVTKDIPDSLPELQTTLIPASDENQPAGIEIDVLPGSADNEIRFGRRGVISVALLTSPTFYAPDVDRDSLQFGPGGALVATPGGGPVDVDGDEDMDYVIQFRAQDADFSCGDTTAYLSGLTNQNEIIVGSDSIQLTGCP